MTIRKAKGVENNFSIVPNDTLNDGLSWAAKGLLVYLCSKPDDWEVSVAQLVKHSKESSKPTGRDGTYTIINELIAKGYIVRNQENKSGQFGKAEYIVSSTPLTALPDTDEPHTDLPDTVNPTQQSKVLNKEQKELKDLGSSAKNRDSEYPVEFLFIWDKKPQREGANPKKKAFKACNARIKQGASWKELAEGLVRYHKYCYETGKLNTAFVMQVATFFGPDEHYKNEWTVNHEATNTAQPTASGAESSQLQQIKAARARSEASEAGGMGFMGDDGCDVLDLDASEWQRT